MLYPLIAILLIFWMLGMLTSFALGGLIHILLAIALVLFVVRLISGRKAI
ncbi:MAG: hypothetical protein JWP91_602 [Fibrobacteres bacterium]|nr:hypothetical protein [Fibrobacterota bacterium]